MVLGMLGGALTGVIGWLVWSAMSLVVGRYAFAGTSDYGEMLRVIGFAFAPLAIGIIPWLGFVGALWSLVAAVIAIREGVDNLYYFKRQLIWMGVGMLALVGAAVTPPRASAVA